MNHQYVYPIARDGVQCFNAAPGQHLFIVHPDEDEEGAIMYLCQRCLIVVSELGLIVSNPALRFLPLEKR